MKIAILFTILSLGLLGSSQPEKKELTPVTANEIIDENFLKKELQNAVLEFAEDLGVDTDSIYVPFTDELPLD